MFDDPKPADALSLSVTLRITVKEFEEIRKETKQVFGDDTPESISKYLVMVWQKRA